MTSGSSQGLFVIVAVVIFGIFVVISYLLFRDKLQTGLASIFQDSIDTTLNENLQGFELFEKHITSNYADFTLVDKNTYDMELHFKNGTNAYWGDITPIGFHAIGDLEVPYGYRLTFEYELYSPMNVTARTDLSSYYTGDKYLGVSNDIYGGKSTNLITEIKANTWTKLNFWYENNHYLNTSKQTIKDGSNFGVQYSDAVKLKEAGLKYKIRNVQYKLEKI